MTAVIYQGDRSGTGFFHRTAQYWLDRSEVAELVQSVVKDADWSRPTPDGRTDRRKTARTEILLAVLTFCYVMKMFRASEIEAAIASGLIKGGVVDGAPLDRYALIVFRRHHRDLLQDSVTKVLEGLLTPASTRDQADAAIQERAASQAQARIECAIEWDCLERDE